jgi:hypothetical protein
VGNYICRTTIPAYWPPLKAKEKAERVCTFAHPCRIDLRNHLAGSLWYNEKAAQSCTTL